jgi:hypothetical protein
MAKIGRLTATLAMALALLAVSANAASAANKLHLDFEHVEVPVGSKAVFSLVARIGEEGCDSDDHGTLVTNGKPTDALTFSGGVSGCVGAAFKGFTGTATSVKIAASGAATVKTKNLTAEMADHCNYRFGTIKLTFVPGFTFGETLSVAKLNRASSSKPCAPTQGFTLEVNVVYETEFGGGGNFEAVVSS